MRKSEFTIGIELSAEFRAKICEKLRFVAELASGEFTSEISNHCSVFVAPRSLGIEKFSRCRAYIEGIRDGLLNY